MPITQTLAHQRPVSGDIIMYGSVSYMEWATVGDKRTLKLFTGISNHPVLHLSEVESYDFYVEWLLRFGNQAQYNEAVDMRKEYKKRKGLADDTANADTVRTYKLQCAELGVDVQIKASTRAELQRKVAILYKTELNAVSVEKLVKLWDATVDGTAVTVTAHTYDGNIHSTTVTYSKQLGA